MEEKNPYGGKSSLYASGVVAALSGKLLREDKFNRMIESATLPDALKVLSESGYADGMALPDQNLFEKLPAREMKKAAEFLSEVSSDKNASDCFLLPVDYLNAKLFYKARAFKKSAEETTELFSGILETEIIKESIAEGVYEKLPAEMAQALDGLDAAFTSGSKNPALVDVTLDKAMYAHILRLAKRAKNRVILNYFRAEIDFANMLLLVRVTLAALTREYFERSFVEGGTVKILALLPYFELSKAAFFEQFAHIEYAEWLQKTLSVKDGILLQKAEADALNYKKDILRSGLQEMDSVIPVIDFYLAKKTEAENVLLVLTGIKNRAGSEKIRERMRELYV